MTRPQRDMVNSPLHYKEIVPGTGLEAIDLCEQFGFCLGNVLKYVIRSGRKTDDPLEDLKKGRWYLDRHIARLERERPPKAAR